MYVNCHWAPLTAPQLEVDMQMAKKYAPARRLRARRNYMVQLPRPQHQLP